MSSWTRSKCACVAASTVAGLLSRAVTFAASMTSQCDVNEYYDVTTRDCRHCDVACFEYENGTIVRFDETRCFDLCPGYIKEPRLPVYPGQAPEAVKLTVMEGGLFGFVIALLIICVLVVVILRRELSAAVKRCFVSAHRLTSPCDVLLHSPADVSDTSYVKLADPSDEVEIVDRVTCV